MLSDKLIRLRVKALHCPEFIARCLGSQQAQDQLKGQKSGLAKSQTNISQQGLLAVRLVTPTLPEQQKIAAFLTAVDGRIEQLSRKKALLEAYKKGVMQQLFTQTLRFQDDHGHDFPAWEEKTLGDLCRGEVSNGVFNDPSKVGRGYKLINVSDMFGSFPVDMNKLTLVELELGEFKKNQAKYGDLFFTRSSLVAAGIAWSNVNLSRDEDITFDGHLMKISPDLNAFNPVFLAYLMHSEAVRRQFISRGKTGTMTTIGQKDILAVSFSIPCLPEQTKIAGFLSALDGKIGAVGEQMRQTQAWKKGLLQQMFV